MKISILITSISNFGQKGFYNAQEVGLAKALASRAETVDVFKLVPAEQEKKTEEISGYTNVRLHFLPAKNFGINGVLRTEELRRDVDILIHFSDTQFSVPTAYRWCQKHGVRYVPYIGVIESHSTSRIKQWITNFMFRRNVAVYKKCVCCVKTPSVEEKLKELGIGQTVVAPVGLDTELLKADFEQYDPSGLKKKYGYQTEDKVLLFIGRMIDEKQPVRMVEIFSQVYNQDTQYKLLMIGAGELRAAVEEKIKEKKVGESVKVIERIPNSDIWELYRFADAFVNLNQVEIFGMALLEAMYYGCKVVAWKAPGPNFIIENGVSGLLAENDQEIIARIRDAKIDGDKAQKRILGNFTWKSVANTILSL